MPLTFMLAKSIGDVDASFEVQGSKEFRTI